MAITMRCPGCQTRFEFADDLDGRRIKCKSCGDIFRLAAPAPARKARDDEDDRPRLWDDDDDRPRSRRRDDEDDDRPSSRYRRPVRDEDEDDRPSRPRRRDDDSDDEFPRRRCDEEDDRPRKKGLNPLVIVLPVGILGLVGIIVVIIIALSGGGKGKRGGGTADLVVGPSRSCPLEVAEKDVGTLVLPDRGNTFGLLRKKDGVQREYVFEPYDLAAKRRVGKFDLNGVSEPKGWALSPDGKHLLIAEAQGLGWAGDQWLWLWSLDGKRVNQDKWFPYQRDDKNPFDSPALHRAEFVGNDRVLTLATNRSYYVYHFPSFESNVGGIMGAEKDGLGKRSNPPRDHAYQSQWEAAWTADRKKMAVWTGELYAIVSLPDGVEVSRTTSARRLAKDLWGNTAGDPNRVKAGPAAFSPDGNTLAAVIQPDFGQKRVLCLWDAREIREPATYPLTEGQWSDAAAIYWWGNKFVVTHGGRVDGILIDVKTGLARRQLMAPTYGKYGFTRDGKLWYAAGEDRTQPATLHVVDALDPDQLTEGDDYEQIRELNEDFFLRRLWLEPTGVLRQPTRDDPPIKSRLVRRP